MITDDVFPVYAQYNEDIILAALLSEVKNGFYVDVGANHEKYHSVTRYFYERGWSGINIEPIPRLLEEIAKKRKRDINLQLAISTKPGSMTFREYPMHDGLSTLSDDSKADATKQDIPFTDYTIKVETLARIFGAQKVMAIDFLKVDVEGYEYEVLKSNDWKKYRPAVIAIEANHRAADWSRYLQDHAYDRVIFDGLNEYYIDQAKRSIFEGFAERAAVLTHSAIRYHHIDRWQADLLRLRELDDMTKRQDAMIKGLRHEAEMSRQELERIRPHTLADKRFTDKLRVSFNDLLAAPIRARLFKHKT